MDDRNALPPGFTLDEGVDITGPRTADSLCLVYDAAGKGGRQFKVKEYFPLGLASRGDDLRVRAMREADRELFEAGLQSFIAFCERLAAIEHKSVEPLVGLIEGHGSAYLVLEQPRGVALHYWLDALGRPVEADELEMIAAGLCEGLAVAHAADLLHLDLAPDTVFVHSGAQPVLVDFAATAIGFAASAGRPPLPAKLGFSPPEREAGDLVHMGSRSDIYAASAILYRLATGEPPLAAGLRRAGDTVAAKLAASRSAIPRHVLSAIEAGLALDPDQRPASAAELHARLRAPQSPSQPLRPGPVPAAAPVAANTARLANAPASVPRAARPAPPKRAAESRGPGQTVMIVLGAAAFALAGALAYNLVQPQPEEMPAPVPVGRIEPPPMARTDSAPASRPASTADGPLDRAAESRLGTGDRFRDCADCPDMVVIPAGSFTMGSAPSERGHESDEGPQRKVEIPARLAVSRTTVTRAQFELFVASSGFRQAAGCRVYEAGKWVERTDLSFRNPGFRQDGDHPVVCVSWSDARAYAEWLSTRTGKSYRLPSEAEWEYAARAGTSTPFWWGSEISTRQANYDGSLIYGAGKPGENREATVRALEFEPNAWGLFQVHGNVSQWVEDCWNASYRGAPTDGSAWIAGDCARRVLRGGSWGYAPKDLRAAYREGATAGNRNYTFGFRVAREVAAGR